MTVEKSERTPAPPTRPGLTGLQVVTSALASVSAAVIASFFGVAGTLIGAALASVITTVSAALYGESLRRTTERLHRLRSRTGTAGPTASAAAGLPARLDPRRAPRRPPAPGRPCFSRVALAAAAVFGLAMVLITTVELIGQRPVSAMVGAASQRSTTTVGELTGGGATSTGHPTPSPAPASPGAQTTAPTPSPGTATRGSQAPAPASTAPPSTSSTSDRTAPPRSSDGGTAGASAPAAATTAP